MRRVVLATSLLAAACGNTAEPVAPRADATVPHDDDAHTHDVKLPDASHDHGFDVPALVDIPNVPESLAETGLYADFAKQTLAPDVIAYETRFPLWSDGSDKSRWLWLPPGTKIDSTNMDYWVFPKGTKAWKEFRRDGKRLETRFLEKTGEGPWGWRFVAYAWNAAGTEAKAAKLGTPDALGTKHDIPSQEQCDQCHSGTRDGLNGVGALQLSAPEGDGKGALALLVSKGLLTSAPPSSINPPGAGTEREVLGYLHGNCGYCHGDFGRWAEIRPLRLNLHVTDVDPKKTPVMLTATNVAMHHNDVDGNPYIGIVPGDPDKSHLWVRMTLRDFWAMPPAGSEIVDEAAVAKTRSWILSLPK